MTAIKVGPKKLRLEQARKGDILMVRYYDCVLFKDTLISNNNAPLVRETVGWLDYQSEDYIRLIWERYAEPSIDEQSRVRITGLALRKCDIIEVLKIE
jgi:hypothetical protein